MPRPGIRLALIAGLGLIAAARPAPLEAGGGSRSGPSSSTAGPVKTEAGTAMLFGAGKIQAPLDAVYWIDYRGARLYATIPAARQTTQDVALLRDFAERDLIADFGLAPGVEPRFVMQTASLGGMAGGQAFLLVIETTTKQVGVYQAKPKANQLDSRPEFDRLQLIPYGNGAPRPADAPPPGEPIAVAGPLFIQPGKDGAQAALDVVYWLDDPREARLRSVVPTTRRTAGEAQVLSGVGERDLMTDFKIKPGTQPRFLLNCVALGAGTQGASALLVIETTTKQVAAYRPSPRASAGGSGSADIELIQVKPYVESAPASLPAPRAN